VFGASRCPRSAKASARFVFDLEVQRRTSIGLPAVEDSTTCCRIGNTALYDKPRQLPSADEGSEMRKLRSEMHRRMLGNGYCARPVEMDCYFESICESCTFFVTTLDFRPTLQRQRDDATKRVRSAVKRYSTGCSPDSTTTPHDPHPASRP
jgi:hypothetical protein